MSHYDDYLRWLYRGGRPRSFARVQNTVGAVVFGAGIWPRRLAALEVPGRRSGRIITFPVVIADWEGGQYLVAMLGERTNWVQNLHAADGRAVMRHGRREAVRLVDVPAEGRPAILRRYLAIAPGARPHIPAGVDASDAELQQVAATTPVFEIVTAADAVRRATATGG